jgi:hypothetical protein
MMPRSKKLSCELRAMEIDTLIPVESEKKSKPINPKYETIF